MPAGMIQVAIAASTISANRIVYADGSVKRRFFSGSPHRRGRVFAHLVPPCAGVALFGSPGASSGAAPSGAGGMVATLKPR